MRPSNDKQSWYYKGERVGPMLNKEGRVVFSIPCINTKTHSVHEKHIEWESIGEMAYASMDKIISCNKCKLKVQLTNNNMRDV